MRYFMSKDGDHTWYLVPINKRAEFEDWVNSDKDDPDNWDPPEFAVYIQSPAWVTFSDPVIEC